VLGLGDGHAVAGDDDHRAGGLEDRRRFLGRDAPDALVSGLRDARLHLAEADIPYDRLVEMEGINPEFPRTDVVLVIGANDVTNPAARHDTASPIYGMPILDVDRARTVMVIKRSMSPGFAGIDNELYYMDKTMMLFGDAKSVVGDLVKELSGTPAGV